MDNDVVSRIAFAVQTEGMSRREAQSIVRSVLSELQPGDRITPQLRIDPRGTLVSQAPTRPVSHGA
ncbi:hypothetical protein [Aureimonas sp. AU12]|uniref:hypothetical protein n=1 Tax=Aureimonas sp. AU12 TaxID=1638161 RepID=UPI0007827589|nr:hypothetical protein [Aureimonas sp. AU12]